MKIYNVIIYKDMDNYFDLNNNLKIEGFVNKESAEDFLNKEIEKVKREIIENAGYDEVDIIVEKNKDVTTVFEKDADDYYNFIIKETII